jgi:hypothetical protein
MDTSKEGEKSWPKQELEWMPLGEERKEDQELDGRKECMMQ